MRRLTEQERIRNQVMARRARTAKQARRRAEFYTDVCEDVTYEEIRKRDGDSCYLCGEFLSVHDETFDHVVPLIKGGAHVASNIRLAHRECNSKKGKGLLSA
jgi:5-methylcytosine-specific restriction endonuclease McrA